jgi:protein transport protein SEC24
VIHAIETGRSILQARGGRLVVVMAGNPPSLKDRLRPLAPKNVLGTDEERSLYDLDPNNVQWKDLCTDLVSSAVSVDFFVACSTYVDIGTLQWVTNRTAGRVYYYNDVTPGAYELKFQEELRLRQNRIQGYDGVVRVRCSKGVNVVAYRGAFTNDRVSDELELCALDENSTLMLDLAIDSSISTPHAVIQVATLYTTSAGKRVVRLHTLQLNVSSELTTVFRMADLDSTVYWTASVGTNLAATQGVKHARGEIARRVGEILASYRQHCARNPTAGQLILPEALKLLPAYVLGLLKSSVLRPASGITPHQRCYMLKCLVPYMLIESLLQLCYPRGIPLHTIEPESPTFGFPNPETGNIMHPAPVRLLRSSLPANGVTLFDDGLCLRIFFGADTVNTPLMADLLSAPWAAPEVDIRSCPWDAIPKESAWAQRVNNIVAGKRQNASVFKMIYLSKAGDPDESSLINAVLIEDAISSSMSLTGFLKHLHQKISNK